MKNWIFISVVLLEPPRSLGQGFTKPVFRRSTLDYFLEGTNIWSHSTFVTSIVRIQHAFDHLGKRRIGWWMVCQICCQKNQWVQGKWKQTFCSWTSNRYITKLRPRFILKAFCMRSNKNLLSPSKHRRSLHWSWWIWVDWIRNIKHIKVVFKYQLLIPENHSGKEVSGLSVITLLEFQSK